MKITIAADIHVGVPGKLDDIMWAMRKMRQYNADNNITYWIILGDLLHNRESIDSKDLNILVNFLIETDEEFKQKIITFPGNHDMYLKNSWDITSLKPLSRYLTVINDITNFKIENSRFWVIPFIHYEKDYMDALDKVSKEHKKDDVLLTHIGVNSAILNTCFLLKSWSVVHFGDCPFDRIYTGHFHTHQKVGDNLWYPGSPIPFRFDEGDVDHGFFVYDLDSRSHEFISIWDGSADDDNKPPQYLNIDNIDNIQNSDVKGNIIRIALDQEYTHNQLTEMRNELIDKGARDVKWMNIASKEEADTVVSAKDSASNASELFDRYIDIDPKTKGLNKDLLIKFNKIIMSDGDRLYQK